MNQGMTCKMIAGMAGGLAGAIVCGIATEFRASIDGLWMWAAVVGIGAVVAFAIASAIPLACRKHEE